VIYESAEFSIGSRIEWEDASHFFLSFGVGGDPYPAPGPQDLTSDVGKIHRLMADGQIPPDNPILPGASQPSTIWSYGHRNPQGLYYDALKRTLYATEHGPLGGDELNIVVAGGNYGWPLFSYGLNYNRTPVSDMSESAARAVSILPAKFWGPDNRVAPSGLLFVEGSLYAEWNGAFLLGALNPQHLLRYDPATDETEIVLRNVGRVRDIAQLPSGKLLIAVDAGSPKQSDRGRIIELSPR
jgi:glucose/arabinose dehydrogenase